MIEDAKLHIAMRDRFRGWLDNQSRLAIIDTETTGLPNNAEAEVWQIGIVTFAPSGTILPMSISIRPDHTLEGIPAEKAQVWHSDLAGLPTFLDAYPFLVSALQGKQVISYNWSFDFALLANTCRLFGAPWRIDPDLDHCVMRSYAGYRQEYWSKFKDWGWLKLERACELEGVYLDYPHSALFDALATWELIQKVAGQ